MYNVINIQRWQNNPPKKVVPPLVKNTDFWSMKPNPNHEYGFNKLMANSYLESLLSAPRNCFPPSGKGEGRNYLQRSCLSLKLSFHFVTLFQFSYWIVWLWKHCKEPTHMVLQENTFRLPSSCTNCPTGNCYSSNLICTSLSKGKIQVDNS